jgi:hypothetical protein
LCPSRGLERKTCGPPKVFAKSFSTNLLIFFRIPPPHNSRTSRGLIYSQIHATVYQQLIKSGAISRGLSSAYVSWLDKTFQARQPPFPPSLSPADPPLLLSPSSAEANTKAQQARPPPNYSLVLAGASLEDIRRTGLVVCNLNFIAILRPSFPRL